MKLQMSKRKSVKEKETRARTCKQYTPIGKSAATFQYNYKCPPLILLSTKHLLETDRACLEAKLLSCFTIVHRPEAG